MHVALTHCAFYGKIPTLLLFFAFAAFHDKFAGGEQHMPAPVVTTTQGAVRGRVVGAANGRYAQEFLNIPYAQPPVGPLRFRPPKAVDAWEGVRDGTQLGNACVQNTGKVSTLTFYWALFTLIPEQRRISEDCLNLNIHMPFPVEKHAKQASLPIMVYIHGGAFRMSGNSVPIHNASILASEINAIIVMINYRVGALGFYTLKGVDGVSGNQGLMDQSLALRWVRDNAASFGGDPGRITLAGVSAGSASVHYHIFSPISRPLFARSIMHSGTAMSFWSYQSPDEARQSSRVFAISAGCNGNDTDDDDKALFDCMNAKSTQEMITASVMLRLTSDKHISLSPTLDGSFITKSPAEHLHEGDFHRGPTMIGTTANESMPLLAMFNPFAIIPQLPNVRLTEAKFNQILDSGHIYAGGAARDAIMFVYRNWSAPEDDGAERWRMLNAICDDYMFSNGLLETLDAYLNHSSKHAPPPVYRYRFNHIPSKSLWGYRFDASVHGDDVPFFFGHPLDAQYGFTPAEIAFTRRLMHDVKNFVHTGNPNLLPSTKQLHAETNSSKCSWPPYSGRNEYFTFDAQSYGSVAIGPEPWRIQFWHRALPYIIQLEKRAGDAVAAREAAEQEPLMDDMRTMKLVHRKQPKTETLPSSWFLSWCWSPVRRFCSSCLLRFLVFVLTY